MKRLAATTLGTCLVAAAGIACSPTEAGDSFNEAVQFKNGKRVVELPPKGGAFAERPPSGWEPPIPLVAYVVESPDELVECVQPYFLPNRTCNSYRPGMYTKQRNRVWVVKRAKRWLLCPDRTVADGCTVLYTNQYPPFKAQD